MTLVKFKKHRLPWSDNMFADLISADRLLTNDFFRDDNWMPAMNIKENDKSFEIDMAAPGFNKKDFEITIENRILHVSAKKEVEKEENKENFTRKEFSYNSFSRSFTLPENVNDEDNINAKYKNGILKLTLAKLHKDEIVHKRIIEIT